MLVDDVAANFTFNGFRMVVMERGHGIKQITEDIHRGVFKIGNFKHVVIMTGREEAGQEGRFTTALNKLIQALCTYGRDTTFTMSGPIPGQWDNKYDTRDLLQAAVIVKHRILNIPGFYFCDVSAWFADRNGVVEKFVEPHGVTPKGAQIIRQRLRKCWNGQ